MEKLWLTSTILFSAVSAVAPASAERRFGRASGGCRGDLGFMPGCGFSGTGFRVTNGTIIGPNGPYVARGVNIYAYSMLATNNGALIKATFKGLNFLRYITRPLNAPETYDLRRNYLTPLGRGCGIRRPPRRRRCTRLGLYRRAAGRRERLVCRHGRSLQG